MLKARLLLLSALLILITSCGKKEEPKPEPTQPSRTSEELFGAFGDKSESKPASKPAEYDKTPSYNENTADMYGEPVFSENGRYVVQISCIASEEIAEDVARKLEKKGYHVYLAEVDNPTPQLIGHYFRVRIGGFDNISDAKAFGEGHLVPAGYDYWVDNKSNDNVGVGGDSYLGEVDETQTFDNSDPYGFDEPEPAFEATPIEEPVAAEIEEPVMAAEIEEPVMATEIEEPVMATEIEEPAPTPSEEPLFDDDEMMSDDDFYDATNSNDAATEPEVAPDDGEWGTEDW